MTRSMFGGVRPTVSMHAAGVALVLAACTGNGPQVVQGECRSVHGAQTCAWAEVSGDNLVAFGAMVPLASIENAPDDAPMTWPPTQLAQVPMPPVVQDATGFQLLTIYWEPHGHPPGPYLVPHFDFHFYNVGSSTLSALDCSDSTKPAQLPAAYELPDIDLPEIGHLVGLCVPQMGMHALAAAELNSTANFEKTMVVGYYQGQPIFIEPMVTRELLMRRTSFDLLLPDVPGWPAESRLPTTFRAEYDSVAQQYTFVFSNLRGGSAQ